MTDTNPHEQRQFSRIPFDAVAHIHDLTGKLSAKCTVIDISLNGILITKPINWQGHLAEHYQLNIVLVDPQLTITMTASVAHIDPSRVGFHCEQVDLDSISHLKRLVELNLGDSALLQRELSALLQ